MSSLHDRLAELPAIVTADHLAAVFEVDRQTIWRWLRSGHIPGQRIGRTWRIFRDDVAAHFPRETGLHAPSALGAELPDAVATHSGLTAPLPASQGTGTPPPRPHGLPARPTQGARPLAAARPGQVRTSQGPLLRS